MLFQRKIYHVVPYRKFGKLQWAVRLAGYLTYLRVFDNKNEAVNCARLFAKSAYLGQVKIHNALGRIQEERTFGNDPRRYVG